MRTSAETNLDERAAAIASIDAEIAAAQQVAAQFGAHRKRAVELATQIEALDDRIAVARDRIRWAEEAANILSCPNCDCLLVVRDGDLVPADPSAADLAPSPDDVAKAKASLESDTAQRAVLEAARNAAHAGIAQAIQARKRITELSEKRARMSRA